MNKPLNTITIYESADGPISLAVDKTKETIWANLNDIAKLFGTDKSGISRHIKNIYSEGELTEGSTVAKNATVQNEGKRKIKRNIEFYNLDMIISIGYRVNAKKATVFRQWATQILKRYISEGFVINKKLIENNYSLFNKAVEDIKLILNRDKNLEIVGVIEIIKSFANTWLSLDAYDKNTLPSKGTSLKSIDISSDELVQSIKALKLELLNNGNASDLFAVERETGAINSIIRNIYQSVSNLEVYPTIEEKAANLLYLIIKNHPFIDGNKRSAAFSFIWFLKKAGLLNILKLSPEALTTITILIAESKMEDKDRMISIILQILKI